MNQLLQKLREGFAQLTSSQKTKLGLAAVSTLALVWGLSVYATRVQYAVLFSNLEQTDGAAVMSALLERQVPYRLAAGGSVIEVPVGQVDELRLALAGEGLPMGGGVGFEIFDKPVFGLSDFVQNVNYRRALERELGRTIQSLDAVKSARVHLALPPVSAFADEQQSASASVVIRLQMGGTLSSTRVRGIARLVASGVEGLAPGGVSIIDSEGRLLSEDSVAGDEQLTASQLEAKRSMERRIESTLVSIIEPVVGLGHVRARATVELNMTRVQRVSETFDPNVSVIRSEEKSKDKRSGGGPGGIPGTESNLPGGSSASAGGGTTGLSQHSLTNFELNKTVSTIAEPAGTLVRQSVAVVVDYVWAEQTDPQGQVTRVPTARTPEQMQKIVDLVRAAVGIDENRGDVLIVENVPFEDRAPSGETAEGIDWSLWLKVVRYVSMPLAVLLVALLIIRPGIAVLRGMRDAPGAGPTGPLTVAQLQAKLQADLARGRLPDMAQSHSVLRRKLMEAASEDPRAAALVIKDWLSTSQRRNQA